MKSLLNTLYVTREDAWLSKDGETVSVHHHGQRLLRIPLHNLEAIQTFGWNIIATPPLLASCAEKGIAVSQCDPHGHLLYRICGMSKGNVLLRRNQYRLADSEEQSLRTARLMITAKILNSRRLIQRALRDSSTLTEAQATALRQHVQDLHHAVIQTRQANSRQQLLGIEGSAAETYFSAYPHLIQNPSFTFNGRNRRPPRDPVNALMSFAYALLANDCRAALEAVGLDAAVGLYHRDRPGRPGLALDLMEELRAPLADRLTLTLINRRQVTPDDFTEDEQGGIRLSDDVRKLVIQHWQERKQHTIIHPFLGEKISVGMIPHIQARLLAQHIRNALDEYPPMFWH